MQWKILTEIFFSVIGGLGLFMLGMKYMSDGLQAIAGERMRRLISLVTDNRVMAVLIGTTVTCVVQSSSITTVMVVGFVNSGFMTLNQAIGVIMGANIGTTITGWILVLNISKYGLPMLGLAALGYRFLKNDQWRYLAMSMMGIGMIFYGLELMTNGFKPIRNMEDFLVWFSAFDAGSYAGVLKCALVGCVLTCIVQSSSATLGITIGLAASGVIPFTTAAALVLGENIGTTITAVLAGLGATTNARRASYGHVIFNMVGVLWITAIFGTYIKILTLILGCDPGQVLYFVGDQLVSAKDIFTGTDGALLYQTAAGEVVKADIRFPNVTKSIAAVHTGFNVVNVILFLPVTHLLARFLLWAVPESHLEESPHLTRLDSRMLETPAIGMEQARIEILRMADTIKMMMVKLRFLLVDEAGTGKEETADEMVKDLFHKEEVLDIMQKEVVVFVTALLGDNSSHEIADEGRRQLRMADELESVGDYIVQILKLHLRLKHEKLVFPEMEKAGLLDLHDEIWKYIEMVDHGFEERYPDIISKAYTRSEEITHLFRDLREAHLERCSENRMDSHITVCFTNALNSYRRVKDHILNFAEAMAGEK